jgi:hypothetical protein
MQAEEGAESTDEVNLGFSLIVNVTLNQPSAAYSRKYSN